MSNSIWYISKYFALPSDNSVGSRGWMLLKEFSKKGREVVVITSDSNNLVNVPTLTAPVTMEHKDGITVVWLKTIKYDVAKSFKRILSWFAFEWNLFWLSKESLKKPDVIIVSSLSLLTIINGLYLRRKYRCRLAFEIRDIWPLTITEEGGFSRLNPFVMFLGYIERLGYRKADNIIGTMPNLSQHVADVLGYEKTVDCIPMGIVPEMCNTSINLTKDYFDQYLDDDFFNVVHAGTVGITNALETFFRAAELLNNNKKIRFVIVGDGAQKEFFKDKYGHLANVIFAPKVAKSQVYSVLSRADVVYFSTFKSKVWEYGQSLNKVVDYMLSGKPVIASYSGYPSMINEAGSGFFVPAEDPKALVDKILDVFAMPVEQRADIGQKGRDWILSNRSYDRLAEQYLAIFERN